MAQKETNYWSDCKVGTGAHRGKDGRKTAQKIGRAGAWSLKTRQSHGLMVGCIHLSSSDFAEKALTDDEGRPAAHAALCQHGSLTPAKTRKQAIVLARRSQDWCLKCAAVLDDAASM